MRHPLKTTFIAALAALVSASPAVAQQAKPAADKSGDPAKQKVLELQIPVPFAVIDIQAILLKAAAVKDIREQITKYGIKFEEEIEKERNAIRTANQELARQRTILSPEAFGEKRRQFEQRVVDVQRLVQERQQALDKSRNEAMVKVNEAYIKIVSELAAEKNLAVILRKDQTAYTTPMLDVTENVLSRLDKQLPKVKVAQPSKEPTKKAPESKASKSGKK